MPTVLSFLIALVLLLPFGWLSLRGAYWLGRRLQVTDQTTALVPGIGVFPLPFMIAFAVVLYIIDRLLHLPFAGQYVFSGLSVGGWIGAGSARIENLQQQT